MPEMKMLHLLAALAIALASSTQEQPSEENLILVNIGGLRSDAGQVRCAIFSSATDFPKKADKDVDQVDSPISHGRAVCDFRRIPPGTYAVSAFHDQNSNGKMDTNFMGIPREGVGASNDARGHFGPPKFSAAAFHFSGGRLDLKVTITYL